MELQELQYFLVSAEKGSLTRAAEALYTTQPHVSQVIRALERELGTRLFTRTGSGIALTEAGERIRFYAQNALKNADLIRESCAEESRALRLAANPSSSLAALAGEYYARTGTALEYTECGIEQMMALLQEGRAELGFLFLPANRLPAFRHMAERRRLVFTPLITADLVLHCGPHSPFFGRERIAPAELDGASCIQLEDDFFSVEELLLEDGAFRAGRYALRRVVRTNSDHLMQQMLRDTALCNVGSYWLPELQRERGFSMAVIEGFEQSVSFGRLQNEGAALSEQAEGFLELLRERL